MFLQLGVNFRNDVESDLGVKFQIISHWYTFNSTSVYLGMVKMQKSFKVPLLFLLSYCYLFSFYSSTMACSKLLPEAKRHYSYTLLIFEVSSIFFSSKYFHLKFALEHDLRCSWQQGKGCDMSQTIKGSRSYCGSDIWKNSLLCLGLESFNFFCPITRLSTSVCLVQ